LPVVSRAGPGKNLPCGRSLNSTGKMPVPLPGPRPASEFGLNDPAGWPGGWAKLFCQRTGVCYAAAMRIATGIFGLMLALTAAGAEIHFNFSDYPAGAMPTNFQTVLAGGGQPGAWQIITAEVPPLLAPLTDKAPVVSRHGVLAQTSADPTDERFPMLLLTGEKFRNFKFTTRFKIVSGVTEQMAGVVFRYQNASNYYVVRVNALDKNVKFYKVLNGQRSDPIGVSVAVAAGEWHSLGVQCEGNQITVSFDGQPVMPALGDNTFTEGRLGFRTKSDAVCYFTDAMVDYTPIVPAAQVIVNGIMKKEPRILGLRIYTAQTNDTTHVIASMDPAEIGKAGTEAEAGAIKDGTVFFGREKGIVVMTLPLHDRNGDYIGAVRVRLKSFFGETQDTALSRARMIVGQIQNQVGSDKDLL
jgi:hypothetical protein